MHKTIVAFVILIIFIAVPLVDAFAQDQSTLGKIGQTIVELPARTALLIIGAIIASYVNLIGLLALQMIHLLLKLASFNNFIDFGPVVTGWTIIRDVVNMSFVVILLVIAVSTILNIEAYSYRRLLPKLVLMAVLINFSRTIAGLLIDVGQVFMLTFVNAFSAAAGGNFLSALRVNDLLSLGVGGIFSLDVSPQAIFASYILAAIAITVTFIVLLTFVGILLFRILTLWFLIIFSPLAFALAAWPSAKANKYYGEWWSRLTDNIIVGPILAFFLWLALMIMSTDYVTVLAPGVGGPGGDPSGKIPGAAGITQLSAPETFASFLFGIGTLLMVLKMVSSMQVAFAGFGMKALDFAKTKGVAAAKLLGKGAVLGTVAGANLAARRIDLARGKEAGAPLQERGFAALTNIPIVRGWARGKLGEARAERSKAFAAEGAKLTELTPAEMDGLRNQRPPILTPDIAAKRGGQLYKLLTDKQYQGWLKKERPEQADAIMSDVMKEYNEVTKVGPTPEITRKAMDIKKFRPDLLPAGADFNDVALKMEKDDVLKITPDTFTKVMERPDMTADAKASWLQWARTGGSVGLRKAAQDYRDKQGAEAAGDTGKLRQLQAQRFVEFKEEKVQGRLRSDNIGKDEVGNPEIAVLMASSKDYSGELEAVLKRNDTRNALRETLVKERENRFATIGEGANATYTPEVQAISETALRSGSSLNQTFNVDLNTANFKEVADRNAYKAALSSDNRMQILLKSDMDMITKNNFNNQLGETVAQTLSYNDVKEMLDNAKQPSEQRNVFNIVSAMKQYAERTNDPKVKAVVQSISENKFMTKQIERLSSGKGGDGGGGGGGGGTRGGRGGGAPPAVGSSFEEQMTGVKEEVKKQVEEQIKEALEEERQEKEQLNKIQPRNDRSVEL